MTCSRVAKVTISRDELRQRQEDASRLKDGARDRLRLIDRFRRESEAEVDKERRRAAERQRQFAQSVSDLSAQAAKIEQAASDQLAAAQQRMSAERDQLATAIERETAIRETQFGQLRDDVDALRADQRRAADIARQWIKDATVLRDAITDGSPHERFAPGELNDCARFIAIAQGNLDDGLPDPAISLAQQAFEQLTRVRIKVELAYDAWRLARQAVAEQLRELAAAIELNALRSGIDPAGNPLPDVGLDVDLWSGGALAELRERVDQMLADVTDDRNQLTTAELIQLCESVASDYESWLSDIVAAAEVAQLDSQLRVNIAELMANVMADNGFVTLADATFEGGDQRAGFIATLRHVDGSEAVLTVEPDPQAPSSARLQIETYDADGSPAEVEPGWLSDLADRLEDSGVSLGPPAPLQHAGTRTKPNPAEVRARKPAVAPAGPIRAVAAVSVTGPGGSADSR